MQLEELTKKLSILQKLLQITVFLINNRGFGPKENIMKIKITVYIHFHKCLWEDEGTYEVFSFKAKDDVDRTFVCEQEIEIEVPDNYDPTAQMIAALEAQKEKAMSDFNKTVMEINARISKLQALEYTP